MATSPGMAAVPDVPGGTPAPRAGIHAPRRVRRNDALLTALLSEVKRARSAFRAGRAGPRSPTGWSDQAQRAAHLASAMESYADAAAATGVPLPYRYRDELRLYRAMTAPAGTGTTPRPLVDPEVRREPRVENRLDRDVREAARRPDAPAPRAVAEGVDAIRLARQRGQDAASARDFDRRNSARVRRLAVTDQSPMPASPGQPGVSLEP